MFSSSSSSPFERGRAVRNGAYTQRKIWQTELHDTFKETESKGSYLEIYSFFSSSSFFFFFSSSSSSFFFFFGGGGGEVVFDWKPVKRSEKWLACSGLLLRKKLKLKGFVLSL